MQFHFFCPFYLFQQFLLAAFQFHNILHFSLLPDEPALYLLFSLFFELPQPSLPKLIDIFFGFYLDQSDPISFLRFDDGLPYILLSDLEFIDFALSFDLLEKFMIGLSEHGAFRSDVIVAVDACVFEEATVTACCLIDRALMFLDLYGGRRVPPV